MRTTKIAILVLVLAAMVLPGCGVMMNAQYSSILDEHVATSAELATRAEAGKLTEDQKTAALRSQADIFKDFQNARDGKK